MAIIANTKGEGEKAGEDFWVKAEKLYYTASSSTALWLFVPHPAALNFRAAGFFFVPGMDFPDSRKAAAFPQARRR